MLRYKAMIVAGLAAVGLVAATPGVASADGPGCVTKREFKQVRKGFSEHRVTHLFDTSGKLSASYAPYQTRDYKTCARFANVSVDYKHHRATHKWGFWA